MSSFTTRVRHEPASVEGRFEGRFAVREVAEDLDVWALRGASQATAEAMALVLNATATSLPAHEVRAALLPFSDLEPLPVPPSAVQRAPADWDEITIIVHRRPRDER